MDIGRPKNQKTKKIFFLNLAQAKSIWLGLYFVFGLSKNKIWVTVSTNR